MYCEIVLLIKIWHHSVFRAAKGTADLWTFWEHGMLSIRCLFVIILATVGDRVHGKTVVNWICKYVWNIHANFELQLQRFWDQIAELDLQNKPGCTKSASNCWNNWICLEPWISAYNAFERCGQPKRSHPSKRVVSATGRKSFRNLRGKIQLKKIWPVL